MGSVIADSVERETRKKCSPHQRETVDAGHKTGLHIEPAYKALRGQSGSKARIPHAVAPQSMLRWTSLIRLQSSIG